ncbi:MAG: PilC/PilY family type IV pilus protein [Gammaproteobacteria bacterium]|nr:PilC/PilY family type IV pilus protein [Gammaproteobacteria bacterium]
MFKFSSPSVAYALLTAAITILPVSNSVAAPGTLPQAPLFLSTIVEPNIFLTLDDSGSMEWVTMVEEGTAGYTTTSGMPILPSSGDRLAYWHPDWPEDLKPFGKVIPPSTLGVSDWDDTWVLRTHHGNSLYYNPAVKYEPWPGTKADGITPMFENANINKVLQNPNNPTGNWVDLTLPLDYKSGGTTYVGAIYLPSYYIWDPDSDANGILETTDAKTLVKIPAADPEMQNFANWFQYYRSRMNAVKSAIGPIINNTDTARMGLDVFNNGPRQFSKTMTDATNKLTLLTDFYNTTDNSTTPARAALNRVGTHFTDTGANAPILPAADGGECQQNFNLLVTDGFWNRTSPGVGNTDIDGPGEFDGGSYADSYSNTLADVAMKYYEEDLRPSLDDKVPTQANVDEAEHQHLVNFAVGFGVKGKLDPAKDIPGSAGFEWPEVVSDTLTTVDDLWHAAYNSRGSYLSARDSQELESSLDSALSSIAQRTGTAAAVAVNSARLSTESVVYLAQFNSNRWQGNLLAFPIIDTDTGELAATPKWDAASILNARDFASNPRVTITYDNSPSVSDGVPFQWANISTAMKNDLKTNALGGVDSDAVGRARLDYLRGDRSNEDSGLFFRTRVSMLGDIVNSGPVFVGSPTLSWPDFAPFPDGPAAYSEFKNGPAANRKKMVYVGANDGMLHAFDDDTGEEIMTYIPGLVSSTGIGDGLHYLTEPNYVHRFYVDQTPTLSDIYLTSGSNPGWNTVLVGALRGGGRGLFALNVTDPVQFSETSADQLVLWEFSSADDIDLGYTFSRPAIALANNGRWVAIFGNGYNDLGSGEASLFVVDIEKGADGNWQTGDYEKITTTVGDPANRNGLATPALADVDGDGTVDRVYAGDLRGNMWAFDLSSSSSNSWQVAHKSGSTPIPLFTTPPNKPITAKPVLAKHPTQPDSTSPSNAPNIMVFFGTGQYLVDADKKNIDEQTFYGVWDKGDAGLDDTKLIKQDFDTSFSVKVLTRNPIDYATDYGWYFHLPETGERSVTAPIARADTVFFNSFVPVDEPCSVGGFGFKFAVDMATGGSPLEPTFDANNDGVIDEYDQVSNGVDTSTMVAVRQEGFLPEPVFIEDLAFTAEEATKVKALKNIPVGRFSWQELIQ